MSYASLLRHRATIYRRSDTPGSDTTDWNQEPTDLAALATDVRCRIDETRGRQVSLPDEAGPVIVDAIGYFVAGVDLTEADQVVQTRPATGRVYEVAFVRDAAGQGHHTEVDLRLVH